MSKLGELLNKECPDGVEYKILKDIAEIGTGSSNANEKIENGKYPFFVRSQEVFSKNEYEYDETAIIIPGDGNVGKIFHYIEGKYALHQRAYRIHIINKNVIPKYYFYYMTNNFFKYIQKIYFNSSVISIRIPMLNNFSVAIPPIEVQEEIVRILDTFTKYQDLLNRELELRKKQYEYYRNYLFNKIQSYNNVLLGDIADISVGSKPEFISENETEFEYINAGTTNSGYTNNYNCLGDTVTTPSRGQGGIGYIGYQKNNFWLGALCYQIRSNKDYILTKYIYYYLKNNNELILKIKNSGGLPSVNRNDLIKINIKFPNLEYQKEIINILDQFDTLCNDITRGLPAEIEMRKKQYEYYRDKLLTFKEKK